MKVLHLSSTDAGGAGLCAYRIHKSMLEYGLDSKMLVLEKVHNKDSTIVKVFTFRSFVFRVFHKFLRLLKIYICEYDYLIKLSEDRNAFYSRPTSPFDISNHSLIKEADIIHLHWVDNFIDLPAFFRQVNKPIIWTLHDEGLFYGTAHYSSELIPDDKLEIKYSMIKKEMILNRNQCGIVFLSNYFKKKFLGHQVINGCKVKVINNSVDGSKFIPIEKTMARNLFNLPLNKKIFIFVAAKINDPRKGLSDLIEVLERFKDPNMMILAVGNNTSFTPHPLVYATGVIRDSEILSQLFSASDYYVMPSKQEAFAQTPLEAMACGLPVVAFPVSGTEELIDDNNGVICKDFSIDSLEHSIYKILHNDYSSSYIRDSVLNRFSPSMICDHYLNFYSELLKSN